jgi:hypothetical protein
MQVAKAIMDRLDRYPKSGFSNLIPADRRDIAELVAKEVIDTMLTLGTYVTAGAQDYQVATLEQVTIKGSDKVKLALVPAITDGKPINLDLLAQNSGKQVVVAFINGVAYQTAREALSKAITRQQTDWINREQDREAVEAEQPAGEVIEGTATAVVANITAHATGDLIADQPGEEHGEDEGSAAGAQSEAAGDESGAGVAGSAAGVAGAGEEGADAGGPSGGPDGDVPPPPREPTARKPRRSRAGWAGHH